MMSEQLLDVTYTDDCLNAQQIEELLQKEEAKAEEYAAKPELFTLFSLEVEIQEESGKQLVTYDGNIWSCTCAFFEDWHTCRHIRSTACSYKTL